MGENSKAQYHNCFTWLFSLCLALMLPLLTSINVFNNML